MILAGGVAAILAGIRRVKNPPRPPPQQLAGHGEPPAAPPQPGVPAPPPGPAPPIPTGGRPKGPDSFGIALIVFGAILVFAAGPWVFGDNGVGTNVSIPLPLLIVAGVLVAVGLRRRKG